MAEELQQRRVMTDEEVQASCAGELCAGCGRRKKAGRPFCANCWAALPGPARWKYYGPSDAGFPEWFRCWARHLELNPGRVRSFPEAPGELPYHSLQELTAAGYRFIEYSQCGSARCLAPIVWLWTPSLRRLAVDEQTLQPHRLSCKDPDWVERNKQQRAQRRRDRVQARRRAS